MNSLEKLSVVERSLKLLADEVQQIKHDVRVIETENQMLKNQLCQAGEGNFQQVTDNGISIRQTARENLEKLHREGFHICHLFFGRQRDGECLFCGGMLQ